MNSEPPSENAASCQPADRLAKAIFDNVSHELKIPLTVICAALEQPVIDRAEIAQAAERLKQTTDNMLTASRLEANLIQPLSE